MPQPKAGHLRSLAYLLLAAAIPTIAQQQPAQTTLKVTTQLTRVDVTVTDANGHPVHGLPQSAFTLKEDGKPQLLKNFEESGTQKPSPQPAPPQLPPNTYTNAQPQTTNTSAVNVLLVDNVTTGRSLKIHPEYVAAATREAAKYLNTMLAGTQVILLDLTTQLQIVQPLTTDRDVLLAALHSVVYKQNPLTTIPCIPMAPCDAGLSDYCRAANAQSQLVVGGLEAASAYLAGIKGRKNIIWFTPGIPWLTDYPSYDRAVCLHDYTGGLQRDYNLLAASQAALYPIDPGGIEAPVPSGFPPSVSVSPSAHISIEDLADATGGQAFYNTNDLTTAIGKAIATGSDSYSLFYVPPTAKYDGQYHKINVKLDQPGLRLVYRKGYTSLDPAKAVSATQKSLANSASAPEPIPMPDAALHASMVHGAAPSTQILFTVAVTPTTPAASPTDPPRGQLNPNLKLKGKPLVRYDFKYAVPPDQLTLTSAATGTSGSVEFTVAAYDGTGEMLNVVRQTASFTIPPTQLEAFLRHPLPMLLQLDLPPGPIFLRIALHDLSSNKLGTLEIPLTVPK
jgi:VWFA-related protein